MTTRLLQLALVVSLGLLAWHPGVASAVVAVAALAAVVLVDEVAFVMRYLKDVDTQREELARESHARLSALDEGQERLRRDLLSIQNVRNLGGR